MTLLVHILAGLLALAAGYAALFAAKGARLHRRSGMVFVYAMVVMGVSATVISAVRGLQVTMFGGVLVVYLVLTALTTVRPPTAASRRVDSGAMVLAMMLAAVFIFLGLRVLASPGGTMGGVPAPPIFMNGAVALLAGVADLRVLRAGGIWGPRRLARHLWRMCFALWIAAGSFFLGQADEFPQALRIYPLLAIPALAPLAAIAYWQWRLRGRRPARTPDPLRAPAGHLAPAES
ncbi:MAG TPA: hypothetical protein VF006_12370 [Longimicrobium sp.]